MQPVFVIKIQINSTVTEDLNIIKDPSLEKDSKF